MNRVDVFLLHGIGKTIGTGYYDDFVAGIRKRMPIDADVNFHPVEYSNLLDEKEDKIFSWLKGMAYQTLRRFACDYICDVLAFSPPESPARPGDFYYDVNRLLMNKFDEIESKYPKSKKVIISHSLGTQIAFAFAWRKEIDWLFTMGSPILYFSVRFNDFGKYPESTLHNMTNFYNVNDPVATIVSRNPNLKKCEDIKVKSFNPKYLLPLRAHSYYWVSDEVTQGIAKRILSLG